MSRRARTHTSVLGIALLFLAIPLWWGSSSLGGSGSGGGGNEPFVVPADFQVKLLRAGLGADALAAAGVSSGTIISVLQAAADQLNAHPGDLASADASLVAARVESDRLRAKIQSGQASQEEISAYQSASSSLASATTARQAALDAVFTAATANLTAPQRAALTQIRANRAVDHSKDFPIDFLVVSRTEAQWVALRDALANERLAVQYPDLANEVAQQRLATMRSDGSVAAARTSVESNLSSVTTAWNTASGAQ
ncbi:MAG: hypothetical protein ACKVXR_04855 [Planctomycetota bacterium]